MPYLLVEDFKNGLDVRKSEVTAPPGTLLDLENAHITRGGEIEQRQAFAVLSQLPVGMVKGMAGAPGLLYLFGQDDLPAGFEFNTTGNAAGVEIVYQKLGLPTGITSAELVRITSVEWWGDKPFVCAEWRTDETKPDVDPDPTPDPDEEQEPSGPLTASLETADFEITVPVEDGAPYVVVGEQGVIVTQSQGAVTYDWNAEDPVVMGTTNSWLRAGFDNPDSFQPSIKVTADPNDASRGIIEAVATEIEGEIDLVFYVGVTDTDGTTSLLYFNVSATFGSTTASGGGGGGGDDGSIDPPTQPN